LAAIALSGCQSKLEKATQQAKEQAARTGQAQQVVSTDNGGNMVRTVVQPPQPGQTTQAMTTTVTPPDKGDTANRAPIEPTVTPVPPPGPPPPPVAPLKVHVAVGTEISIRVDQRISVKTSRPGETFTGEVVAPVNDENGNAVIPKGAPVEGKVVVAKKRGHFKGASEMELRLTSLTLNGTNYPLDTHDLIERKKGKGKRTAGLISGGAGLGMLIGGVASGGRGQLIGGVAGAGAGTAGAGLTGNRDLVIPAEAVVRFKLKDALEIEP
jgi:hypothetical protein